MGGGIPDQSFTVFITISINIFGVENVSTGDITARKTFVVCSSVKSDDITD